MSGKVFCYDETMNQDVTEYIQKTQPWQAAVCEALRKTITDILPSVEERLQYGKPHYLQNGSYAAVIHVSKDKVSFMLFNATDIPEIKGFLRSMGGGERKVIDIKEGQQVDYQQIADLIRQTITKL
jgi:hypothetical protein